MIIPPSIPPSPVMEIRTPDTREQQLRLWVKRDDLLHPDISGNKWRKLRYNLSAAQQQGKSKWLTFGGAYSNHLAAVAAAGKEYGFATIGIVRGERMEPLNPTLSLASGCGMELIFISRSAYHDKAKPGFLAEIGIDPQDYYILPEGGSNCHALPGCAEIVDELAGQLGAVPDYICTACGTGATLAGIISGLQGKSRAIGIPVLKGDFMQQAVSGLLKSCKSGDPGHWEILPDYHFGGYARFNAELIQFINFFSAAYHIPLDPVYTGKLFYGVFDQIRKGYFREGSWIVLLHTGGLQGIKGFNERFGELIL